MSYSTGNRFKHANFHPPAEKFYYSVKRDEHTRMRSCNGNQLFRSAATETRYYYVSSQESDREDALSPCLGIL